MTVQDALKGLKRLSKEFSGYKPNEEMFDIAINALEKQIPKEPIYKTDEYNSVLHYGYCPSCLNYIGMRNSRLNKTDMYNNSNRHVCPYCGQMIELED